MDSNFEDAVKVFKFALPFVLVELTEVMLAAIDKSLSNSLGETAIIVFASFSIVSSSTDLIHLGIKAAHMTILAKDSESAERINSTALSLSVVASVVIAVVLLFFAKQITFVFVLEDDAREILATILRLKAIRFPLYASALIFKNMLLVKAKTNRIWVAVIVSAAVNIFGDILSIKLGYGEIGIYVATIISTFASMVVMFVSSGFKLAAVSATYAGRILRFSKDLVAGKIFQKAAQLYYYHVASTFGTEMYAVHCVCQTVNNTLCELAEGYENGLVVMYARELESDVKNLRRKVNAVAIWGIVLAMLVVLVAGYPLWFIFSGGIPWEACVPYVWLYALEFIALFTECNFSAWVLAHGDSRLRKIQAFVGGICIRVPLCYIVYRCGLGVTGMSIVCFTDRAVRVICQRIYIKAKGY